MRILLDVAHPANVHYFKNFINIAASRGHKILVTARDKDVTLDLLEAYGFEYQNLGTGTIGSGIIGKILYVIYADWLMYKVFKRYQPEMAISFSSSYVAHVSRLFKIPHITFEDTEHARANRLLYSHFTDIILTPESFYEDLGLNQFRFNARMESFYLHRNRFSPKREDLKEIGIDPNTPYTLFRFVSWNAFHDIGEEGIQDEHKSEFVKEAAKYGNVYISSEGELPQSLSGYRLQIEPHRIHTVLAFASLYVGEGATMASECALLGVPSIYINSLPLMGYLLNAENAGLVFHLFSHSEVKEKLVQILENQDSRQIFRSRRDLMLRHAIDPNDLLLWLVEKYPNSKREILDDLMNTSISE